MKYRLETIPVWDSYREGAGCPLCRLDPQADERLVTYYLGPSVMNPETRVKVNERGFCPDHLTKLLARRQPHSLGLMLHTHLTATRDELKRRHQVLEGGLKKTAGKSALPLRPKALAAGLTDLASWLRRRSADCLICEQKVETEKRYTFTILYLWKTDEEFRTTFASSDGFCQDHTARVLEMAPEALGPAREAAFVRELLEVTGRALDVLEADLLWFTQKFDALNADKPWGSAEGAHRRAVARMGGDGGVGES